MKKIDLHIHTVPTFSDSHFDFSLEVFERYVREQSLDAVAITNHDVFDLSQFEEVSRKLDAVVFPGIEINVDGGHVLVISNPTDASDFAAKAAQVTSLITKVGDSISVAQLKSIFGNLADYLVIPHYEKAPPISGETLHDLMPFSAAGEVDSAKKFIRALKDSRQLAPVLFSDARISTSLKTMPTRHTFVDCGEITIGSLKSCMRDKSKVALSREDGNRLWQVLPSGLELSSGLNVLLGARSSGKTYLLDEIASVIENAKYIRQFALVQQDAAADERDFKSSVEKRRSAFVDSYLLGLKHVVDDVVTINLESNDRELGLYVETLLKTADEASKKDSFSKAALFDEVDFEIESTETLAALIGSVRQVIENREYRPVIEKHVSLEALKKLAVELIEVLWKKTSQNERKRSVNALIAEIKQGLKVRTSATQVRDVDLYRIAMDRKRVSRFTEIVNILRTEAVVFEETVQGFRVEARRGRYEGAGELKAVSGLKTGFSEAFEDYESPYALLQALLRKEDLPRADLFRFFAKITYRILNRDGFAVSGGERSEFRLLQEIADAQNFDILLIDEPESSFDNLFLNSDVNKLLKAIASTMPVLVVTHNNTVGASVGPDYVLHTRKEIDGGGVSYRIYSGYPSDTILKSLDGKTVSCRTTLMDSLEAGVGAYEARRKTYEIAED